MSREDRDKQVQELRVFFSDMQMAVLADYRGMTVTEMTDFRAELRKVDGRFRVVKNTLSFRAAEGTPLECVRDSFVGPIGIVFTNGDPVATAKVLAEFTKKNQHLTPKAGMLSGRAIDLSSVKALALLPDRPTLLAKALGSLNAPATNFLRTLSAVPGGFVKVIEAIRAKKAAA